MFLSTNIIMDGYKKGIFPMAESAEDPYVFWVSPDKRGIIEIKNFKVPKSLKKFLKKTSYSVLVNNNFEKVISLCAKISKGRTDTWINGQIKENYCKLFSEGHALSIECYDKNTLIGGLYGVKLGSIFFGESMSIRKQTIMRPTSYPERSAVGNVYDWTDPAYSPVNHTESFILGENKPVGQRPCGGPTRAFPA